MNKAPTKSADEKFCHECGAVIRVKAEICPKCGVRQWGGVGTGSGELGAEFTASGRARNPAVDSRGRPTEWSRRVTPRYRRDRRETLPGPSSALLVL